MKQLVTLCLVCCAFSHSSAQPQAGSWHHYTNSNYVTVMCDDGPFLWLGTTGGLVKYDRDVDTFCVYGPWNSGLPYLQIQSLTRDRNGGLWVSTLTDSLVYYMNGTWTAMHPPVLATVFAADSAGRLWAGGEHGLAKYQNGTWTMYTTSNAPLSSNTILSLSASRSGRIWILTDRQRDTVMGSLIETDGESFWVAHNVLTDPSFDTLHKMTSVLAARDGSIWLTVNSSTRLYHVRGSSWDTVLALPTGLGNRIVNVTEDTKGVWVCTAYGASHFVAGGWEVLDISTGFPFRWPAGMLATNNEQWFISPRGGSAGDAETIAPIQILARHTSDGRWRFYDSLSNCSLRGRFFTGMTADRTGRVWFGEKDGTRLSAFGDGQWTAYDSLTAAGDNSNPIFALAADSADNIWIATKGVVKFDGVTKQRFDLAEVVPHPDSLPPFSNNCSAIAADVDGNVWVGTVPPGWSGVAKYDGTSWTPYQHSNSPMPDINVKSIATDAAGYVWIATAYMGVVRFDRKDEWIVFNTSNSALPSNRVLKVDVAPNGDVWAATLSGVAKWDGQMWTSYAGENPIAPDNVSTVSADATGDIWVGGFSAYVPAGVARRHHAEWTMFSTTNSDVGSNLIENIIPGKDGDIWIGTYSEGVIHYIPPTEGAVGSIAETQKLSVWPDPTSVAIHVPFAHSTERYEIRDALGRAVLLGAFSSDTPTIDIRVLPAGIYTLFVGADSQRWKDARVVVRR